MKSRRSLALNWEVSELTVPAARRMMVIPWSLEAYMARRLIKHVKVAAAVALLLDGGEELVNRAAAAHRSGRLPRAVNELALVRAAEEREEMLARTADALKIARAAAGRPTDRLSTVRSAPRDRSKNAR